MGHAFNDAEELGRFDLTCYALEEIGAHRLTDRREEFQSDWQRNLVHLLPPGTELWSSQPQPGYAGIRTIGGRKENVGVEKESGHCAPCHRPNQKWSRPGARCRFKRPPRPPSKRCLSRLLFG